MRSAKAFALVCVLVAPACSTEEPLVPPPPSPVAVSATNVVPHQLDATTGEFKWLVQFGTAVGDSAWDVRADVDGNVYIAGETGGALPGQTFAGGALDAFVRKYDADGHELWTRQFGTVGSDRAFAIFTSGADVYVAGLTTGEFAGQVRMGTADAFLRKLDASGNEQWTRQFGTAAVDEVIGIFADATGVYVSGDVAGALPGQTHFLLADAFVRKYSLEGDELWTHQFGSPGRDLAFRITGDHSGVYVAGAVAGPLAGQTFMGTADAFVRKYGTDGTEVWTRQFGTGGVDLAIGVASHPTGLYVVGRTDGALPGQAHAGTADAFVRKYDFEGTELWTRQFGTVSFDVARGVSVHEGVVHVSGPTQGAFPGQINAGANDIFVRAYTPKGRELWMRQFGSELGDNNWGLSDAISGLYVAGTAGGPLPGLGTHGAADAFVGKLIREVVVEIDIKPGSDLNPIKLGSGRLPIAILSSLAFDATTVDPATVTVEGVGVWLKRKGTPMVSVEDVNEDGIDDLVVHIETEALEFDATDLTLELTARTFGGQVVFGVGSIGRLR